MGRKVHGAGKLLHAPAALFVPQTAYPGQVRAKGRTGAAQSRTPQGLSGKSSGFFSIWPQVSSKRVKGNRDRTSGPLHAPIGLRRSVGIIH